MEKYEAVSVLKAVFSVFIDIAVADYAKKKTTTFMARCGADMDKPKEQLIDKDVIKDVAYAMLDADWEELFWLRLGDVVQQDREEAEE